MTQQDPDAVLVTGLYGSGKAVGDLVVDGTQPVSAVAAEILGWLGWLPPTG